MINIHKLDNKKNKNKGIKKLTLRTKNLKLHNHDAI